MIAVKDEFWIFGRNNSKIEIDRVWLLKSSAQIIDMYVMKREMFKL